MQCLLAEYLQKKLWLLCYLLLYLSSIHITFADNSACQRNFSRIAVNSAKATGKLIAFPFRFMNESRKQFFQEVSEEGPIRLLLAKREDPEKFHWLWLLSPPDAAVELASKIRMKFMQEPIPKRFSMPFSISVLAILGMYPEEDPYLNQFYRPLEEFSRRVYRSTYNEAYYLQTWTRVNKWTPEKLAQKIAKHRIALSQWRKQDKPLARVKHYRTIGVLQNPIEQEKFDRLMHEIYWQYRAQETIKEEPVPFGLFAEQALQQRLKEDSFWQVKSKAEKLLLSLAFHPLIKVNGVYDTDWLQIIFAKDPSVDATLHVYKQIEEMHEKYNRTFLVSTYLAPLVNTYLRTQFQPQAWSQKLQRVKKLQVAPERWINFARVDLAEQYRAEAYAEGKKTYRFMAELDFVELLLQEPELVEVKELWQQSELSYYEILQLAMKWAQEFMYIYDAVDRNQGQQAPIESLCELREYNYFSQHKVFIDNFQELLEKQSPEAEDLWKKARADACRIVLLDEIWKYYAQKISDSGVEPNLESLEERLFDLYKNACMEEDLPQFLSASRNIGVSELSCRD